MADITDENRGNNMGELFKQLLARMEALTAEVKVLRAAPVAPPPPHAARENPNDGKGNDGMPALEDDIVQVHPVRLETKSDQDQRFAKLEEQIRLLQGSQSQSPTDLSVYAKVKVPSKFKMPDFEKYDGTSCPRAHLQMYLVRMTQYVNNAPLMINSFQASLTGPALRWYITKNINLLGTWDEVNDAFLKQYKFIMDITPSREDLERAEKKKTESFKEYAIRWRNLAAQISPEPTDQELRRMFVKTLPFEYRTRLVTATVESFNQLIPVGEQIEIGLRDGWFIEPAATKRINTRKDQEPAAEINVAYTQPSQGNNNFAPNRPQYQRTDRQPFIKRDKRQFTPLPGSLTQVLGVLRKKGLLTSEPKRPNSERFSSYDPSKKCDYHMGEVGHATDDCYTLKHRVQNLLDTKAFSFKTDQPNVQSNPLPDHVATISEEPSKERGTGLEEENKSVNNPS